MLRVCIAVKLGNVRGLQFSFKELVPVEACKEGVPPNLLGPVVITNSVLGLFFKKSSD
jgi:hypothetical protein